MANLLTKENQLVFIGSTQLRGVQNASLDYQTNSVQGSYLGNYDVSIGAVGAQVGRVSLSTELISSDILIQYTGESPINGFLLKNKNNSNENYSFTSGFLSSYTSTASVGDTPKIDASFEVFGNIGRITPAEASDFSSIAVSSPPVLNIPNTKDISLSINDFNTNQVISYEININVNRRADFAISDKYPRRVRTNWPIEILVTLVVDASEYKAYSLRDFPLNSSTKNISISLLNSADEIMTSYSFSDMVLSSERYSANTNSKSTVTITYKSFMGKKPELVKHDLEFFLSSTNRKSIGSTWRDLTFNKNNFNIPNGATLDADGAVDFNGSTTYLVNSKRLDIPHSITLCFWIKSSDVTNGGAGSGLIMWGEDAGATDSGLWFEGVIGYMVLRVVGVDTFIYSPNISPVWSYICVVIDRTANFVEIYKNGVFEATNPFSGTSVAAVNTDVYIGCFIDGFFPFLGQISKIQFYKTPLSASEILQNYKATKESFMV